MAWAPVDDSQTPNWNSLVPAVPGGWSIVPAANGSGWNIIQSVADGAFQFGAFQPAFQIGVGTAWIPVDDSQTTIWVPIPP